jgi:hypothetical protein
MELMLPDLGTTGYHCKEFLFQEIRISVFETTSWKLMVPGMRK